MRHVVVTRTVMVLALMSAGACLLFASYVGRAGRERPAGAPAVTAGGELFERRCAGCHAAAEVAPAADDPAVARASLLRFLAGHGHSDAVESDRIADFLGGVPPAR